MTLEQVTDGVDVLDLTRTVEPDDGATISDPFHQAKMFQTNNCLTHDMALDCEALRKVFLDQTLTWQQPSEDDVLLQLGRHDG